MGMACARYHGTSLSKYYSQTFIREYRNWVRLKQTHATHTRAPA